MIRLTYVPSVGVILYMDIRCSIDKHHNENELISSSSSLLSLFPGSARLYLAASTFRICRTVNDHASTNTLSTCLYIDSRCSSLDRGRFSVTTLIWVQLGPYTRNPYNLATPRKKCLPRKVERRARRIWTMTTTGERGVLLSSASGTACLRLSYR